MAAFAVQSNVIRGLSKIQYEALREMCRYSNNLYNVALYNIRQCYFNSKNLLTKTITMSARPTKTIRYCKRVLHSRH